MNPEQQLAEVFEAQRPRLKAVAYRMLGSFAEADDAVQETWFRLRRSDTSVIENLQSWLTTVVARVCLDLLRNRRTRAEQSFGLQVPPDVAGQAGGLGPEDEALLADSVGLALLVVLNVLTPAERLAFVLHDLFKVPFDEISAILDRSPDAAKMLASRARRRVQGVQSAGATPLERQREVVRAFLAAARGGDLNQLIHVLDPDVSLEVHRTDATTEFAQGARVVASRAMMFRDLAPYARPAFVEGRIGIFTARNGEPVSAMRFIIHGERVTGIEITLGPARLRQLDLVLLD